MEYFGTVPGQPAEYCIERVQKSHLYIGIIGQAYGSIEPNRNKSFTEIEYDAACERGIPCLIYLERENSNVELDSRQRDFRERLRHEQIVSWFSSETELCHQFLRDFISCLRGSLADQFSPRRPPTIPLEPFRAFTSEFLGERIKAVAQDKYVETLYVGRAQEEVVRNFTEFEIHFLERLDSILAILRRILSKLGPSTLKGQRIESIAVALQCIDNAAQALKLVEELGSIFLVQETRAIMEKLQRTVLENNEARQYQLQAELKAMLLRLPYIKEEHLADLAYAIFKLKCQLKSYPGLNLTLSEWYPFYELLPCWKDEKGVFHLASNLVAELRTLVEQHGKRCLAIVARAGRGKTNLVCHLSGQLVAHYPVILLSGQWVVDAVQGIEGHVQQQLECNRLAPL